MQKNDITVVFVTDGTKVKQVKNEPIEVMPVSEKEGFVLEGWYAEEAYETRVSFPFRPAASCKLYAKWIDKTIGNEELRFEACEGGYAVKGCDSTSKVLWIPDEKNGEKVVAINENFLRFKTHAVTVHIGKNVRYIEENFSRYLSLTAFDVDEDNPYWIDEEGVLYSKDKTLLYDYPTAKEGDGFVFPSSVRAVGEYAFCFNMFLTSVTVDKDLEADPSSFKKMEKLSRMEVEKGNSSFCSKEGVLYSADGAVLLLYPVMYPAKNYSVASGTVSVTEGAFSDSKIEILNINRELSYFTAPENVPYLREYTVESGNAYFVSRDGVLYIDEGKTLYLVPQGKTGEFTVPDGTETIYDFSFGQSKISKVTVASSVKEIGKYAFSNCFELEEVVFEEDSRIASIEESAFSRCSYLDKVVLTGRVPPSTGTRLFDSCPGDLVIVVPAYTDGIYKAIWSFCADNFSAMGAPVQLYDVTFDACGGTPVSSVRGAYILGSPITSRPDPNDNEYYIFLGWYDNPEGTGKAISFPYVTTRDIVLYAAWDIGQRSETIEYWYASGD